MIQPDSIYDVMLDFLVSLNSIIGSIKRLWYKLRRKRLGSLVTVQRRDVTGGHGGGGAGVERRRGLLHRHHFNASGLKSGLSDHLSHGVALSSGDHYHAAVSLRFGSGDHRRRGEGIDHFD